MQRSNDIPGDHLRVAAAPDLFPRRVSILDRVPAEPVLGDDLSKSGSQPPIG